MEYIAVIIYIISSILIVTGLIGTILPFIPGVSLVFLGTAILAFYSKFTIISQTTLIIFSILTVASLFIDYLSGLIGAKYSGASLWGILGALAGAVIGTFYFGILGLIFAPAIFVIVFELVQKNSVEKSVKSAAYTLVSTISGMVINGIIALTMLIVTLLAIFI